MKNPARQCLYRSIAIAGLIICFCFHASAQATMDCGQLLKQEIKADSIHVMIGNLLRANCFGLDSIDVKVFGNGPVLGTLLIKMITDNNGKLTYTDLLNQINKSKSDTGYMSIRKGVIAMNTLEATKASPETWESSKKLLKTIGTSDVEIEKLHQFMLENLDKGWNYRQLVVFSAQKENAKKKHE
jgi:hypothetical protein